LAAAAAHPGRPALEVEGLVLDYDELRSRARAVAAVIAGEAAPGDPPLAVVLAQRSRAAFVGVLGATLAGRGYVPVLPSYPPARIGEVVARCGASVIIVDREGETALTAVELRVGADALVDLPGFAPPEVDDDAIAYLLFTSGSTGRPKGVMVAQRNIARFLEVARERWRLGPDDRFSHLFEPTFDLSVFDMFAPWSVGGCLCCPTAAQRLLPARWANEAGLTVWFSVPSTALLMKQTRTLEPGTLPGLRLALFCGEALPTSVAAAFARAANGAVVENIYGPTELTLACTWFPFAVDDPAANAGAIVPIGEPFPGMIARVVDESLADVPAGSEGELIMAGPQVTLGYFRDEVTTRAAYVVPPGDTRTFYRTGDRVRRGDDGVLHFIGRLDGQIKVRGHRVELGEVEAAVRAELGIDVAVALGWPEVDGGGVAGIVVFVEGEDEVADLPARLARRLPRYMVPREIRRVVRFPLNANGTIDRRALRGLLAPEAQKG
jgi:amino acid adenylation domain-containing protein